MSRQRFGTRTGALSRRRAARARRFGGHRRRQRCRVGAGMEAGANSACSFPIRYDDLARQEATMTNEVVLAGAVRTPIGTFGGSFVDTAATELGAVALREALKRAGVQPDQVDEGIMGNVLSAGLGMNPARQAAIAAGIPDSVPATSVNKVCGSGLKTVALAAQAIMLGDADVVVAGGMESMSGAPYLLPKARYGYRMGHGEMWDHMIKDGLWCALTDCHMGVTAENVALEHEISRSDQDEFSVRSQQKAAAAWDKGVFSEEIVPVEVKQRKGTVVVDRDE